MDTMKRENAKRLSCIIIAVFVIISSLVITLEHGGTAAEGEMYQTETDASLIDTQLRVSPTAGGPPLDVKIFVSAHNHGDTESSLDVLVGNRSVHTLAVPAGEYVEHELTHTFRDEGVHYIRFGEERETVFVLSMISGMRDARLMTLVANIFLVLIAFIFIVYFVNHKGKDFFGDEKKLYYGITIVGTILSIAGVVIFAISHLLDLSELYRIIGIVCIVIGVFAVVPGIIGYHEEKRLEGKKKKTVKAGIYSVVIGGIGVFMLMVPLIPIFLGVIGIILGKKAMDEGDNQYGLGGVILGCANILISLLLTFMFLDY